MATGECILTLNSGSSSLKFALVSEETRIEFGVLDRIGSKGGTFRVRSQEGEQLHERIDFPDHDAALDRLFAWLARSPRSVVAAGHRLVYGGREHTRPLLIDSELLPALRKLIPFAPEHLPHELKAIEAFTRAYPDLPQVACFDTAFHANAPEISHWYPLPRAYWERGVIRYGFHGLSYEYVLQELERETGAETARGRLIIAHLGNGASMAAIRGGRPVDTTMGLTPAGGLMMGTRSGDLDPGVMLYLLEQAGLGPAEARKLINERSGLLGVSGSSSDMQELLSREAADPAAALAVGLFCYQARKFVGALAAVLGGVDTLIFTAGIGENAAPVRARICADLAFLGIRVDPGRNERQEPVISDGSGRATVRVMKTDEELMIARHTKQVIGPAVTIRGRHES
jgi:acetate kinase